MTSTADMTQHPDVSEISDLTEGLLSPSRSADLRQHLDGCELCADVHASLEEIRETLGTLPGPVRMPTDIAGRIDAALAAEALLDSTAPDEHEHVSRETTPAARSQETRPSERPAGHARGTTGPGRTRQGRRRRTAVLGAIVSVAAVGVSVLLLQTMSPGGAGDAGASKEETGVSSAASDGRDFAAMNLKRQVQDLVAAAPTLDTKIDKSESFGSADSAPPPNTRKGGAVAAPSCVQKGTGRTEPPIAVEQGVYKGDNAYLVVLPHVSDTQQVQAYVIDASCVDIAPASTGKLLLTSTYPRH
ncbi:anti-sigma factor family protein [Streptomyces sp. NPDC058685]|uniref:anti-sigma factor family protein n=1 Tax=Streptomyces sp. NPDC058685 TaxID=3346598 RepID=UPI0036642310